jgi:hypothetical protein
MCNLSVTSDIPIQTTPCRSNTVHAFDLHTHAEPLSESVYLPAPSKVHPAAAHGPAGIAMFRARCERHVVRGCSRQRPNRRAEAHRFRRTRPLKARTSQVAALAGGRPTPGSGIFAVRGLSLKSAHNENGTG